MKELSATFHVEPKMKPPAYINRAARWGDVVIPDRVYKYFMDKVPQAPPSSDEQQERRDSDNNNNAAATTAANNNHNNNSRQQRQEFNIDTEDDILAAIPIPTREEMNIMSIKEIKTVMWIHGISWEGCLEKSEIINRVEEFQARSNGEMSPAQRNFVQTLQQRQQQQQEQNQNNNNRNTAGDEHFHSIVMNGQVVDESDVDGTTENNNNNNNSNSPNRNRIVTGGRVVNVANGNNNNNFDNSSSFIQPNATAVAAIVEMGFPDKAKVEDALRRTKNNVDRAIDLLLSES